MQTLPWFRGAVVSDRQVDVDRHRTNADPRQRRSDAVFPVTGKTGDQRRTELGASPLFWDFLRALTVKLLDCLTLAFVHA